MNTLIFILSISTIYCQTFETAMEKLRLLEKYAIEFKNNGSAITLNHLILRYIRTGKSEYIGSSWTLAGGDPNNEFIDYIAKIEEDNSTKISELRFYGEIVVPTGEKIDFVHLFGAMNGIESNGFNETLASLVGWAGDTARLFEDIHLEKGNLNTLIQKAASKLGVSGQFGPAYLISDLDAVNIMKLRYDFPNTEFADLMIQYYKSSIVGRFQVFTQKAFPSLSLCSSQQQYRDRVFSDYRKNGYIHTWELIHDLSGVSGVRSNYSNHQKAACYAFADYIFQKNYKADCKSQFMSISDLFILLLLIMLI